MEIRVNIPEEIASQARARGVRPEAYVEEILAKYANGDLSSTRQLKNAEEIRAWLNSLAQFSEKIPPMPENLSREWIYQDHD